jgi:hypothetical protein
MMNLNDKKTKITILSVCFVLCMARAIFAVAMAIKWAGRDSRFMCFITGISPAILFFVISALIVWIIIRDFFLKREVKRMRSSTVYKLITASALVFLAIAFTLAFTGCKRMEPTRHPTFEDFEMVKVKLSGNIGQIANNKYEFDYDKNCWKVQVKMKRESRLGDMVEKLMPEGLPTKIFYERELEKYEQKAEIKTD